MKSNLKNNKGDLKYFWKKYAITATIILVVVSLFLVFFMNKIYVFDTLMMDNQYILEKYFERSKMIKDADKIMHSDMMVDCVNYINYYDIKICNFNNNNEYKKSSNEEYYKFNGNTKSINKDIYESENKKITLLKDAKETDQKIDSVSVGFGFKGYIQLNTLGKTFYFEDLPYYYDIYTLGSTPNKIRNFYDYYSNIDDDIKNINLIRQVISDEEGNLEYELIVGYIFNYSKTNDNLITVYIENYKTEEIYKIDFQNYEVEEVKDFIKNICFN